MRRLMIGLLALGWFAGPAIACINDNELPGHEWEFRSQYSRSSRPTPLATVSTVNSWLLVGGGTVLLAGAATVALLGGRSRS